MKRPTPATFRLGAARHRQLAGALALVLGILMIWTASCQQEDPSEAVPSRAALATVPATEEATATDEVEEATTIPPTVTATVVPEQEETEAEASKATPEATATSTIPSTTETPAAEAGDPTATVSSSAASGDEIAEIEWPEGALVDVTINSQVGVLLDELPEEMRDAAADELIARPETEWIELAMRQLRLTGRRLNFRNFIYPGKGQLPLPPEELWSITLTSDPERSTIQGHDLVTVDYAFASTLLSDAESVQEAEPALARDGGQWLEPFVLPVDPDLLLQRTDNACLNEAGFPPNSFDSENAWVFFDFTCTAASGGPLGCHRSQLPGKSCIQALVDSVGTFNTDVVFERLAWDSALADEIRVGEVTNVNAPDLKVVEEDLTNNYVSIRYFPDNSCALQEQCVNDSGWRRVLQFDATVHNVGGQALHIGPVVSADPAFNLFQYNSCHDHFHFSDYGDFFFADAEGNVSSKQAFCVESTGRLSNNELSPLTHNYRCRFQGIQAGWVDEYAAGLDCQWIDITDSALPDDSSASDTETVPGVTLGFSSNPDRFLCEGTPIVDEQGNRVWEPSELTTPDGQPLQRPQCEFVPDWDSNNLGSVELTIDPIGSFVTQPCEGSDNGGHLGPKRNCGFSAQSDSVQVRETEEETEAFNLPGGGYSCEAGQPVNLSCELTRGTEPRAVRICEYSQELESGVACVYQDALISTVVSEEQTEVSFTCPLPRDDREPGGAFSFYSSPLTEPGNRSSDGAVSCTLDN